MGRELRIEWLPVRRALLDRTGEGARPHIGGHLQMGAGPNMIRIARDSKGDQRVQKVVQFVCVSHIGPGLLPYLFDSCGIQLAYFFEN